jgi:hypothetical protein
MITPCPGRKETRHARPSVIVRIAVARSKYLRDSAEIERVFTKIAAEAKLERLRAKLKQHGISE